MAWRSASLTFIFSLAKTQAILTRRFDGSLGGLSLSEFMILYYLSEVKEEKMRRIDLAHKVGLTASAVTRLLLPMEKIGLVKKDVNKHDARVSFVLLTSGGKRKLAEALEDAELLAQEIIPSGKMKKIEEFTTLLKELKG